MTQSTGTGEVHTSPVNVYFGTVLLLIILTAGAFLRFSGIGTYGFWSDELFHVFAAESYLKNGTLTVPWSPREYTRALPVTLMTALSFKLFGQSEASARVLFALTNMIFIIIAYKIVKGLLSRNVALIFAVSISFSVFSIQMSQECRMYTLFQLFYFLMSITFFQGIEHRQLRNRPTTFYFLRELLRPSGISFKFLMATLGLGLFSTWLQSLTINFIFVVLAYCLALSFYEAIRQGFGKLYLSKYMSTIIVLVVAALSFFLLLMVNSFGEKFIRLAMIVPAWYQPSQSNFHYYHRVLTDSHGILWILYPLGAFLAIYRYGKRGLFFVISFCVPFFMHCFFFNRQSERYIFYILPFFVIVSAVAVEFIFEAIVTYTSTFNSILSSGQKTLFYVAVCVSLSLFIYPNLERVVLDASVAKFSNWKNLDPGMVQAVRRDVSITTDRLMYNYYFEQYPNFVIDASDVNRLGGERVIINLADFKKVLAQHPHLYVVTYAQHFYQDAFVDSETRDYILGELDRIDSEADQRIIVFVSRTKSAGEIVTTRKPV